MTTTGKVINKPMRGIRDTMPPGYMLGRTGGGSGPPILLPLSMFTTPGYVASTTIQVNGPAGGDLSGTYPNPTVAQIQGRAVKNVAPTDGQVLEWIRANTDWEPSTAAGDVTGKYSALVVGKIQGNAVKNVIPSNGQVLTWVSGNSDWEPQTPSGGSSNGMLPLVTGELPGPIAIADGAGQFIGVPL